MRHILKIHKHPEFYTLSFYDNNLSRLILNAYAEETSRSILNELTGKIKCLPDILRDGKKTHNFNNTTFYRNTKKLINSGLIVNIQQPITRVGKIAIIVPQYTSLFEKINVSIGKKIDSITATISKDVKKNSVILDVIERT